MSNSLDALFRFSQDALTLRGYRQQVLASNIANADTPGYQARDIDFRAALERAASARAVGSGSAPAALPVRAEDATPFGAELLYRTAVQPSIDNNTVDIDVERAHGGVALPLGDALAVLHALADQHAGHVVLVVGGAGQADVRVAPAVEHRQLGGQQRGGAGLGGCVP